MENILNQSSFSVDFLLGQIAASTEAQLTAPAKQTADIMHIAGQVEQYAAAKGDIGNTLVREVEQYLSESAEDMQQFTNLVQQLGDACLDHTIEHQFSELAEETTSTHSSANHSHNSGEHNHNSHAAYPGGHAKSSKKRKLKKRLHSKQSLLDLYVLRLKQ